MTFSEFLASLRHLVLRSEWRRMELLRLIVNSSQAREQGVDWMLGLDLSERMIARARELTSDAKIEYQIADLETLPPIEDKFELAFSSLAFHYVKDLQRLLGVIHGALNRVGAWCSALSIRFSRRLVRPMGWLERWAAELAGRP